MKRLFVLLPFIVLSPMQARTVSATVYHDWYHNRTTYCGQTYQHWGVSVSTLGSLSGASLVALRHEGSCYSCRQISNCAHHRPL